MMHREEPSGVSMSIMNQERKSRTLCVIIERQIYRRLFYITFRNYLAFEEDVEVQIFIFSLSRATYGIINTIPYWIG